MSVERPIEPATPAPDPSRVHQAAVDVLQALKATQGELQSEASKLHVERDSLDSDMQHLTRSQAELTQLRDEFEAKLATLAAATKDIERQREESERARKQIENDKRALNAQQKDFEGERRRLAEQQQAHAAAVKSVSEREKALETADRQLHEQARQIEPQQAELERRSEELASRTQQLDEYAAELANTREASGAMQAQLARDQQVVAAQREELLERLGSTPVTASPPLMVNSSEGLPAATEPLSSSIPKPAASPAADQFRKLRRDAKRKAIGV